MSDERIDHALKGSPKTAARVLTDPNVRLARGLQSLCYAAAVRTLVASLVTLQALRRVISRGGTRAEFAAALREAFLMAYLSQLGLIAMTALFVLFVNLPEPSVRGWVWWFLGLGLVIWMLMNALAQRLVRSKPTLPVALQAVLLLVAGTIVTPVLAFVLALFQGITSGVLLLVGLSCALFGLALMRVSALAWRVWRHSSSLADRDGVTAATPS